MWLITSDIHLSDKPKDEYRFGLFKWLAKQQEKLDVNATFILGDITENKDKHSHRLVNRVVDEFKQLRPPVYILRGNHDTPGDPTDPFFRFLNSLNGIRFIVKPALVCHKQVAMIPHCRTQAEFDEACKIIPRGTLAVMLHNTFEGAIAESGVQLSGLRASRAALKGCWGVWSGDVHKPQRSGHVTYVGSPYHIKFGDDFKPRVLAVNDRGIESDLHFPALRKMSVTIQDLDDIESLFKGGHLREKDQVKVLCALFREELVEWPTFRREAFARFNDKGVEIYGMNLKIIESSDKPEVKTGERTLLEATDVFAAYCKQNKTPSAERAAGHAIMTGTWGNESEKC